MEFNTPISKDVLKSPNFVLPRQGETIKPQSDKGGSPRNFFWEHMREQDINNSPLPFQESSTETESLSSASIA